MDKNRQIYSFLNNPESVDRISKEIIEEFDKKASKENVDFSFDVARGTGKIKTREANTYFFYDPEPGTSTHYLKKSLYSEDLKDIEENSDEERELMTDVGEFIKKVAKNITNNYGLVLRDVVRRIVLPKSDSKMIPLKEITILSIDIADYDSFPEPSKYLLKVGKEPETSINIDKITSYIHNRQEETGQTVEEILEIEKDKNDIFKNVLALERGRRYLYDISITFFVDYSLDKLPPNPFKT